MEDVGAREWNDWMRILMRYMIGSGTCRVDVDFEYSCFDGLSITNDSMEG
jgi:hypothetical protein